MPVDRTKIYVSADDYFSLGGSATMKLSIHAALDVCERAASLNELILRIEGGLWHNPGFEARLDCIWDGLNPPASPNSTKENNCLAADFIASEMMENDTFIITSASNE